MHELTKDLNSIERLHNPMPETDSVHPLQVAAKQWAEHSLNTYNGRLLKSALGISAAMANFTSALETVNPAVYEDDCKERVVRSDTH